MSALAGLPPRTLSLLADALSRGRLAYPVTSFGLAQCLGPGDFNSLASEINGLAAERDPLQLLGHCLGRVIQNTDAENRSNPVDLIWSGPDEPETLAESTQVTIRELFRSAEHEILVTGYAVYNGKFIFEPLAHRMAEKPGMKVNLVMNIPRKDNDTSLDDHVVMRWKQQFIQKQWPSSIQPAIYYDPRSLTMERSKRAVMHAKCILVDQRIGLVSSANLTEAALARNIEAGLIVRDPRLLSRLHRNFEVLISNGHLKRL